MTSPISLSGDEAAELLYDWLMRHRPAEQQTPTAEMLEFFPVCHGMALELAQNPEDDLSRYPAMAQELLHIQVFHLVCALEDSSDRIYPEIPDGHMTDRDWLRQLFGLSIARMFLPEP